MPAKAGIQHRLPMARVPLIDENAGAEIAALMKSLRGQTRFSHQRIDPENRYRKVESDP
jgi:hypothetical protein